MVSAAQVGEHVARIQEAVRSSAKLRPVGGGSKPALSSGGSLELSQVTGVLEYDPLEYTFTALAGTPLQEVEALLAAENQYLPFDPPLATEGATLGGTVAAGLSGPGRFRYGSVRDFLLGVRFVSGTGEFVMGGGKVVKNAAGFDFPKLMVGALGQFGVMVELTFKVFPRPETYATLMVDMGTLNAALTTMQKLALAHFELTCLDLEPPSRLTLRVGGTAAALHKRLERLQTFMDRDGEIFTGEADETVWREARAFAWLPAEHSLVKVPLSPRKLIELEAVLAKLEPSPPRRYSVGGNVLWLGWPDDLGKAGLETLLNTHELSALALTGSWQKPLLGKQVGQAFAARVSSVLDPDDKFTFLSPGETHAA
ncbi:FAD-binding protein [soil metagenome]